MGPDALMRQKIKQKRHREGYEEGASCLHRPLPAAEFIASDAPVELLGQYSRCGSVRVCVGVGGARRKLEGLTEALMSADQPPFDCEGCSSDTPVPDGGPT